MNTQLRDPMEPRPLAARWVVCGKLTLETALHLGGVPSDLVDMPVLRDARQGRPLLPGTTLAGALRSALADRLAGYGGGEPALVAHLFGGRRGNDREPQSPLVVFDSLGQLPEGQGVEIRDGVAISPRTGVAEERKKYDYEVLPAGTIFPVRIDLLWSPPENSSGESKNGKPWEKEKELLEALAAALETFVSDSGGLGARRSRGLGRFRASWIARRFDLSTPQGWLEWALADHQRPIPDEPKHSCSLEALQQAAPEELGSLEPLPDARRKVAIDLELQPEHDLLVRSPGTKPQDPDVSHLRSGGRPVLPGTSLAGVLRAHALRIARLVRASHGDSDRWVERLFGPRFEGLRPGSGFQPHASRLRVAEAQVQDSQPWRQTRIAIDRFTQGVVQTALFDEQPEVGGTLSLRLEIRNPQPGELGLVLLVLKDLLDARLPVGGTSSVGRGFFRGTATVSWYEGNAPSQALLEPGKPPQGKAAERVDQAIREFHEAKSLAHSDQKPQTENTA